MAGVKLTFLYHHPLDAEAFDSHFFQRHLALVDQVPQVRRREVARVLGTPDGGAPPYHVVAEYYFDSPGELEAAFASEAGGRLNEDLSSFAGQGVDVFVSAITDQ